MLTMAGGGSGSGSGSHFRRSISAASTTAWNSNETANPPAIRRRFAAAAIAWRQGRIPEATMHAIGTSIPWPSRQGAAAASTPATIASIAPVD